MTSAPFDTVLLDRLMEQAGLDLLLVTSKHNVHYMLGGHKAMFFEYMDAMGISRYLPVLVYARGAGDRAGYIGHRTETAQREVAPFWVHETRTDSWGSVDAIEKAVAYIGKEGFAAGRIGVEASFLPHDSAETLRRLLPGVTLIEALPVLEQLRLRKTPHELHMLKQASERVLGAMQEAFEACRPGVTKRAVIEALRRAETDRGLNFEYCLMTAGTSVNRAPSDQVIAAGDIISLDSGANYHGYIGDLCRMGVVGEPDAELRWLLAEVEAIQQAAFRAVRPGAPGSVVYAAAEAAIAASRHGADIHFVAHGMGLVSHEAPHLTKTGPVQYGDEGAEVAMEQGVVLSVETTLKHPVRGFMKLEDTVVVTETGHEVFGDAMRGWNPAGQRGVASLAA